MPIGRSPNPANIHHGCDCGVLGNDAKPFVLKTATQYHPDPPPDLKGDVWARDYNEIKEIGEKVQHQAHTATDRNWKDVVGGRPDRLQPMGTPDRDCQEYVGDRYGAVYGIGYRRRG